MKRRTAIHAGIVASTTASCLALHADEEHPKITSVAASFSRPIFIATWNFGQVACERSREVLSGGGSLRDAVERGINVTELDETNRSVGYGGLPNADGVVQLDACFMDGNHQKAGSVAALEGFPNPISVARRVMETTKHVMLVGSDAAKFALKSGFQSRDMLTPGARDAWRKWSEMQSKGETEKVENHDTISLLGVNSDGHIVGGCSTSGLAFKLPGRVGDSPIIGSGLYVDGQVGAAGATGVGENVLRYCASFLIVEFMRQGMAPTEACKAAILRVVDGDGRAASELSINFVAINKAGVVGAAGTDEGFRCAIVDDRTSVIARPLRVN